MRRDIDGAVTRAAVHDVQIEEWPHIYSSNDTNVSDKEDQEVTEVKHGESRQGQTLFLKISIILSDDDSSSHSKQSCMQRK